MKEVRNTDGERWPWEMNENEGKLRWGQCEGKVQETESGEEYVSQNEKGEEVNFCSLNIN